jgi:hypothetical protein
VAEEFVCESDPSGRDIFSRKGMRPMDKYCDRRELRSERKDSMIHCSIQIENKDTPEGPKPRKVSIACA